jgi:uroporphyrinogen-III synthase
MPDNIHLLSTALLDNQLIGLLHAAGIRVTACSFIKTQPTLTPEKKMRILQFAAQECVVIFTSQAAVAAVQDYLSQCPPSQWSFYSISGATEKTVQHYYPAAKIKATAYYAQDLVRQLIQNKETAAVFFCGNKRLDTIPKLLHEANIPLEEIQVYETKLTPYQLSDSFDGILFKSPSAVESFFSVNTLRAEIPCFAIGNTTAQALRSQVNNPIIISTYPNRKDLTQTIIHYFNQSETKSIKT